MSEIAPQSAESSPHASQVDWGAATIAAVATGAALYGHHIPQVEDWAAAVIAGGATGAALYAQKLGFDRSEEKRTAATTQLTNGDQARRSLQQDQDAIRKERTLPGRRAILGVGLAAIAIWGGVHYESVSVNKDISQVDVVDASNSMRYTTDLGESRASRFSVASKAISEADYSGKLGVIQTGANSLPVVPVSRDWKSNRHSILTPSVNPNSGKLVPALELAERLLPINKVDKSKREGTINLITDGTSDDTPGEMTQEIKQLRKDGVKLRVILTGTSGSTYRTPTDSKPVASSVQPELFNAAGHDNVKQAQTVKEVTATVKQEIAEAGINRHKHPYLPLSVAGVVLFGYGVMRSLVRSVTRRS